MTGLDGLLKALTRTVIETALNEDMAEHVGYDKHKIAGRNRFNSRNGIRVKTVLIEVSGPVQIGISRGSGGYSGQNKFSTAMGSWMGR